VAGEVIMTSERLYRILLKAYPARYRHEYEEAMAQCFRDQLRTANTTAKRICFWFRIMTDFTLTVPVRHLERLMRRDRTPARPSRHGTFDDYSGLAKRAIFFARYEAASFSGPEISLEHLLLGTLREDQKLAAAVLGRNGFKGIVRAIEAQQANPRRHPTRKELSILRSPLILDCKKTLKRAWEEAHTSGVQVSPRHLLSAILHQNTSLAARLLREHAVDLSLLT
jgi:hypothetical protein